MTVVVRVAVPGAEHDVTIGRGVLDAVPSALVGAVRVAVLHAPALAAVAQRVAAGLHGMETLVIELPDAEAAKTLDVASSVWDALGAAGLTRSDALVSVGGGATTDLAGFVAAGWLRGVRVVHVPTTALAMVDAAVGGKTAVNTSAGKNLVGAFHQPAAVVCDLDLLATVPPRDHAAGLAEVVKAGFIADPQILELVDAAGGRALDPADPVTDELVARAVRVKADVVARDPREGGLREVLNYGHTLAHAIERVEDYQWRHGDAVSVGLCFAAALGRLSGRLDDATADRHRSTLQALGLPVTYSGQRWPELLARMALDKKVRGRRTRFIVLDGLGRPGRLDDPPADLLESAFAEVAT